MSTEWHRWEEVKQYVSSGHRLFRSSAPNYVESGGDGSQNLTPTAAKFLQEQGITGVISFNQNRYIDAQIQMLQGYNIVYLHLPVKDFTAPTIQQLDSAIEFYRPDSNPSVLMHCGYGWGRTGTGITALQLFKTKGANPPESEWQKVNHVERPVQMEVLREKRDSLLAD